MKNLYLIGAGGHAVSAIDVIESTRQFHIAGIFDMPDKVGSSVLGYKIIGSDEDIKSYISQENFFLVCVGQIKSAEPRTRIFNWVNSLGGQWATVISPRAYVSRHSKIGNGTLVMHDALINANVEVGQNCILNTKSLLEHDVVVGNHCHISTAAILNGNAVVNDGSFVGSNSVTREGAIIPYNSIVPAGSFFK